MIAGRRVTAVGLALAGIVVAAIAVLPAVPAAAATEGPCPTSDGVTVVVDFAALGGGVVVRCAPGRPGTGFDALREAGFAVTLLDTGFLCRIDDRPAAERESCVDTPPPDAYWAYSYAPRGGQWNYSNQGGGARQPIQGTVEGWRFSDGTQTQPGIDSPAAAAVIPPPPPAAPRPTTAPTTRPTAPRPNVTAPSATAAPGGATTIAPGVVSPTTLPAPEASVTSPGTDAPPASVLGATETPALTGGMRAAADGVRRLAGSTATGSASSRPAATRRATERAVVVVGDDPGVVGSPAATAAGLAVVALVGAGAGLTHRRRSGARGTGTLGG